MMVKYKKREKGKVVSAGTDENMLHDAGTNAVSQRKRKRKQNNAVV
jgi:hypothetical protein